MRTAESIPSTISDHSPRPETPCSKHSMKRDSDSMGLSSKGIFFGALLVLGVMRSRMVGYNVIVGAGNMPEISRAMTSVRGLMTGRPRATLSQQISHRQVPLLWH